MNEIDVYGGIAVHTRDEFDDAYAKVCDVVDGVHVDFADGVFVPNTLLAIDSVPLMNIGFAEAHLMVKDPLQYFDLCAQKAFRRIIFHASSLLDSSPDALRLAITYGKNLGVEMTLSLEIGTPLPDKDILLLLDMISVMTVRLGYSGGDFVEEQLQVVAALRELVPEVPIHVDGGVSQQTIGMIKQAGVQRVVSTSWLQKSENVRESYSLLKHA